MIFAQSWLSSPIRREEVKHWKSKYNVRPSISLTNARVFRRIFHVTLVASNKFFILDGKDAKQKITPYPCLVRTLSPPF